MKHTLLIGYGNLDRQDDGVAWHVLADVAQTLGRGESFHPEEGITPGDGASADPGTPDFWFTLQLTPEMAESVAEYERVCFIDAHTGAIPEEVCLQSVSSQFQRSPLTHHLTPQSLLALCEVLYQCPREAILVSVRGYQFGFTQTLSAQTQALSRQASQQIVGWIRA